MPENVRDADSGRAKHCFCLFSISVNEFTGVIWTESVRAWMAMMVG
jgi:hypothetical protein